jgi:ribosome maturation factor RimP
MRWIGLGRRVVDTPKGVRLFDAPAAHVLPWARKEQEGTMTGGSTTQNEQRFEPFLVPLDGSAETVRELVEPMLATWGMELVQLHVMHGPHKTTVRLFIDKKNATKGNGIGIDDLEKMSRLLGDTLDVEDGHRHLFKSMWEFEVSSPGVDRPLTKKSHFARAKGEPVKVKTRGPVEGARSFAGTIDGTTEKTVRIVKDDGGAVDVPFDEITSAHTVFRFEQAQKPAPKRKKKSQQRKPDEE